LDGGGVFSAFRFGTLSLPPRASDALAAFRAFFDVSEYSPASIIFESSSWKSNSDSGLGTGDLDLLGLFLDLPFRPLSLDWGAGLFFPLLFTLSLSFDALMGRPILISTGTGDAFLFLFFFSPCVAMSLAGVFSPSWERRAVFLSFVSGVENETLDLVVNESRFPTGVVSSAEVILFLPSLPTPLERGVFLFGRDCGWSSTKLRSWLERRRIDPGTGEVGVLVFDPVPFPLEISL